MTPDSSEHTTLKLDFNLDQPSPAYSGSSTPAPSHTGTPVTGKGSRRARLRRHAWLRAMQFFGLTLGSLTLLGSALLATAGARTTPALSDVPQFTVLLAGRDIVYCYYHQPCKNQDQRTGLIQTPNTDTLMVARVSEAGVSVLNIPRDTNVGEFDREKSPADQKVNSRYWTGGPQSLVSAVEEITGERVDSYVVVRADYVTRVIDALGGLDVTVPEPGIEWVDKAAGVDLKLQPGNHHLSGEQAVLFLRVRKGFGDDYGRIDHQKQALTQLVGKLKTPQGLAALPTILGGVGHGVETNVDPNIVTALLPKLTGLKLRFATLPTSTIPGSFNLAVDRERLARVWGQVTPEVAGSAAPQGLTISIHDASGQGLGAPLGQALKALGYKTVRVQTSTPSNDASQVFTQDNVRYAEELADTLGLPRLQGERFPVESGEIGILLGKDALPGLAALKTAYTTP
ncbi:LCP family protein [Deinococcus cavernae]